MKDQRAQSCSAQHTAAPLSLISSRALIVVLKINTHILVWHAEPMCEMRELRCGGERDCLDIEYNKLQATAG
jgi:hypothetical protein